MSARDVMFLESTAEGHICPPEPEDNESELTSTTTLDVSDDEMSMDADPLVETKEEQPPREPMRSEAYWLDSATWRLSGVVALLVISNHDAALAFLSSVAPSVRASVVTSLS